MTGLPFPSLYQTKRLAKLNRGIKDDSMTLSNRSRFADDVVKESTPLCTRISSLYGWTEGLSQTRFNSFFAGIPTRLKKFKGRESVTAPLTLLACLVEVSRVSTADPISLVMKRSLFRSSTKKGIVTTTKLAR